MMTSEQRTTCTDTKPNPSRCEKIIVQDHNGRNESRHTVGPKQLHSLEPYTTVTHSIREQCYFYRKSNQNKA